MRRRGPASGLVQHQAAAFDRADHEVTGAGRRAADKACVPARAAMGHAGRSIGTPMRDAHLAADVEVVILVGRCAWRRRQSAAAQIPSHHSTAAQSRAHEQLAAQRQSRMRGQRRSRSAAPINPKDYVSHDSNCIYGYRARAQSARGKGRGGYGARERGRQGPAAPRRSSRRR